MASCDNIQARGSLYSSPVISPRQSTAGPPLEQVASQPLSFSISRILGIEDNVTQTRLNSGKSYTSYVMFIFYVFSVRKKLRHEIRQSLVC